MSAAGLGWGGILRIGLVQAAIGAIVVFATAILNRVMVVELGFAASIPGALIGLHYAVQTLRPRWGHGSDGGRRTPWILGGMAALALGATLAADATALAAHAHFPGLLLALAAFALIGLGVGAAGTALLTLLAERVDAVRRPAAASLVWMMMIAGFILTSAVASRLLTPFSLTRLTLLGSSVGLGALAVSVVALAGLEGAPIVRPQAAPGVPFRVALRTVWADPAARRLTLFIFLAMLAYSAEDLILEPFAALAFGWSPAQTAALAALQNGGVLGGMILVAAAGRWLSGGGREGLARVTLAGCLVSAAGLVAVALAGLGTGVALLRPAAMLLGFGNGMFSVSAIGLMMGASGQSRSAGVRMGVFGAAQALAFGLGGLGGAAIADLARHAFGRPVPAYAVVLAVQAGLFVLAGAMMRTGERRRAKAPLLVAAE